MSNQFRRGVFRGVCADWGIPGTPYSYRGGIEYGVPDVSCRNRSTKGLGRRTWMPAKAETARHGAESGGRGDQLLQLLDQFGDACGGDAPEFLLADLAVLVSEEVPLADDPAPGDFRMVSPEIVRHATCGLADDLQLAFHRRLEHFVLRVLVKRPARDETNWRTLRAASSMSQSNEASSASRGTIDHLPCVEDGAPAEGISQTLLFDQIDVPSEQGDQFIAHLDQMEQVPFGRWLETHQHIHVAMGAEVGAQDGPEQRELPDLPAAAELLDPVHRNVDVPADRGLTSIALQIAYGFSPIQQDIRCTCKSIVEGRGGKATERDDLIARRS